MRYLIIFLMSILLVSCCGQAKTVMRPTYHRAENSANHSIIREVLIDKDFNTEQKFCIESALEEWNFSLNGYIVFKVVDDNAVFNENFVPQHNQLIFVQSVNTDPDSGVLAYTNDLGGNAIVLYVNNMNKINRPITVVEHEIGHSLFGPHNSHKGSLMYPYFVEQGDCIDQYSMQDIKKTEYFIDLKNTNFCIID